MNRQAKTWPHKAFSHDLVWSIQDEIRREYHWAGVAFARCAAKPNCVKARCAWLQTQAVIASLRARLQRIAKALGPDRYQVAYWCAKSLGSRHDALLEVGS